MEHYAFKRTRNPLKHFIARGMGAWDEIHEHDKRGWIYRGQSVAAWSLQTSFERTSDRESVPTPKRPAFEKSLFREFRRVTHHYQQHLPAPRAFIEWFALMQHHGAPTRLLDFSYSIYVASYFALEQANGDCTVWAINADWARNESAKLMRAAGKNPKPLLSSFDDTTEQKLGALFRGRSVAPLGVWPVNPFYLNERLQIQRGVFAMPGDVTSPFIENLEALPNHTSPTCVRRLVLRSRIREEALQRLFYMGISRTTLFPGLDGFAESLGVYHTLYEKHR